MLLLLSRSPLPDAPYWPGRRWLAVVDALAWPVAWVLVITQVPVEAGVLGQLFIAVAALGAARRCHRALWVNHRYRFTTRRWGRVMVALLLVGLVLKVLGTAT